MGITLFTILYCIIGVGDRKKTGHEWKIGGFDRRCPFRCFGGCYFILKTTNILTLLQHYASFFICIYGIVWDIRNMVQYDWDAPIPILSYSNRTFSNTIVIMRNVVFVFIFIFYEFFSQIQTYSLDLLQIIKPSFSHDQFRQQSN